MIKWIIAFSALLLSGCLDDPALNVKALSGPDRFLATGAAFMEGVYVEVASRPNQWIVSYGEINQFEGFAFILKNGGCEIHISNNLEKCEIGGRDRRFFVVLKHEIRHCIVGDIIPHFNLQPKSTVKMTPKIGITYGRANVARGTVSEYVSTNNNSSTIWNDSYDICIIYNR